MIIKELISRIVHKSDVEKRWQLAVDFVPLKGEIIIYDRDDNIEDEAFKGTHSYARFKIGDGVTKVNELPFANSSNFIGPDSPDGAPDGSFWVDTDEEGGFKITVNGIAPDENGNIEIEVTDPYVLPVGGEALGGVKNGGNVVIDAAGAMNVEIPSIEGLATEEYVDAAIEAIPKVEVNYPVTSVNGQTGAVNLDAEAVGALSKDTVIPTVPTNVSAFVNDAGYLTQHQSLAGLATEDYVDEVAGDLQDNIDALSSAVELLTNGVDAETVDGVNDLIVYVNEHGAEVTGMKADIKANADALAELAPVAKTGSWNDLVDKPFGEGGMTEIIWDGNTNSENWILDSEDMPVVRYGWYYASELVPSYEDFVNSLVYVTVDGNANEYRIASMSPGVTDDFITVSFDNVNIWIVRKDDVTYPGDGKLSKAGIYFGYSYDNYSGTPHVEYVSSIVLPGGVKTLDEIYIPSTIARVSDIPTLPEIPEINYPVTSVNGQTGAVVIDIPSTEGLATEEYVNSAITNINTYYTKAEIDNMEFITVDEIDAICAQTIEVVTPTTGTF